MIWCRLLSLTLAVLPAVALASGECDLNCSPQTTFGCYDGPADFSSHVSPNGKPLPFHEAIVSANNKHCECHPYWTGLECKTQVETCHLSSHMCYNGGKCMHGANDDFGVAKPFCDCKKAMDWNGVRYAGKHCEHKAVELCGNNREVFCVNGGTCKPDFGVHPHRPCDCDDEYDGPHCEFRKDEFPTCDLECANGGKCQLGLMNYAQAQGYSEYDNFWKDHEDLMHCVCKPGFHGLKCEARRSTCGEHECFNGGTCVIKRNSGGRIEQHCDCTTAQTDSLSFSGRYCQYESTALCSDDSNVNGRLFCVNGGTCNEDEAHLGCSCPNGFYGPVCEFHDSEKNQEYEKCNLKCNNGGICRKGTKDRTFLQSRGVNSSLLNIGSNRDNEYCVCRPGFVGHTCDTVVEVCSRRQVCLNGGKCINKNGDHKCDCAPSFNNTNGYKGKYCEHEASVSPGNSSSWSKGAVALLVLGCTCFAGVVLAIFANKRRKSKQEPAFDPSTAPITSTESEKFGELRDVNII